MINAIYKRQSIRKYTDEKISHEELESLLKAGFRAPTAMNKQPVKYVVVEEKEVLEKIYTFSPSYSMFNTARAAIIVGYDKTLEDREAFGYVDSAAAVENILLEAYDNGLGTCWCAIAPNEEKVAKFKELFDLSDNYLPVAAIAIGHADEVKPLQERFDENKIKWVK